MQRSTNRSVIHFFPYHRQPQAAAAAATEHGPSDRLLLRDVPAEQVYASTKLDPLSVCVILQQSHGVVGGREVLSTENPPLFCNLLVNAW